MHTQSIGSGRTNLFKTEVKGERERDDEAGRSRAGRSVGRDVLCSPKTNVNRTTLLDDWKGRCQRDSCNFCLFSVTFTQIQEQNLIFLRPVLFTNRCLDSFQGVNRAGDGRWNREDVLVAS